MYIDLFSFEGSGTFINSQGFSFKAPITYFWDASRIERTQISSIETHVEDLNISKILLNSDTPWELIGISTKGAQFVANNVIKTGYKFSVKNGVAKHIFTFYVQEVFLGDTSGDFTRVDFYLPNVKFPYMKEPKIKGSLNKAVSGSVTKNETTYKIELEDVSDSFYGPKECKDYIDHISTRLSIEPKNGPSDWDSIKDVCETILDLLSIAYGDQITWCSAVGFTNTTEELRITRHVYFCEQKTHRKLIRFTFPEFVIDFIKSHFDKFSNIVPSKRQAFMILIRGVQYSAKDLYFPAPIILLSSSIEAFIDKMLPDKPSSFLSKSEREKLQAPFKNWVESNLIKYIPEDDRKYFMNNLKQKFSQLVQKSLRERIENLLNYYNIGYDKDVIAEFAKRRNAATHTDYSYKQGDYELWCKLAALIERLVLKEIGFRGKFIDWYAKSPEEREFTEI